MNTQGEDKRKGFYVLEEFLNACKANNGSVQVAPKALENASNLLRLSTKKEMLAYISQYKTGDFKFVNTEPFRKGVNGDHPLVDGYNITLQWYDLYIAFCFLKTRNGWYIKSFHSSNKETLSISEIMLAKLK